MEPTRQLAIVLRSIPFEDRHRIVTALTEKDGLLTAIAKNSIQSRRFGGTLELFTASEWIYTQKPGAEMCHLSEAHIRKSFEGIRKDFSKLSLASTFNEVLLRLNPQGERCEELFKLHSNALSVLDATELKREAPIPLLNAYLSKLLQWSGSQPRLLSCSQCETPLDQMHALAELTCLIASAGWICPKCRSQETRHLQDRNRNSLTHSLLRISPQAVQNFLFNISVPIRSIPESIQGTEKEHRALFRFLEALFIYHVPGFDKKPIKTLRFLDLESSVQPAEENLL